MRPGQTVHLIGYARAATDPAAGENFNAMIESGAAAPTFRSCSCSAFHQCRRTHGHSLDPPRARVCPVAKVPFTG